MTRSRFNLTHSGKGTIRCLFLFLFTTSATVPQQSAAQAATQTTDKACASAHYDETAVVRSIHDGDTVRLKDGRKIRLIGINTPELAIDNKPAQPLAKDARDRLALQIHKHHNTVKLVYGKERQDHYKRTLAHLFLPDGSNLQADLLAQGLAIASTYPPNDALSDCYHRAEKAARCSQTGIWLEKTYAVKDIADLDDAAEGFHILKASVKRISKSEKSTNIFLEGGILVGIRTSELRYFDKTWLNSLINRTITVRGWLHSKKRAKNGLKFYMQLKHPSAIDFSDDVFSGGKSRPKTALNCYVSG
jgi:micrococcal nuclease